MRFEENCEHKRRNKGYATRKYGDIQTNKQPIEEGSTTQNEMEASQGRFRTEWTRTAKGESQR